MAPFSTLDFQPKTCIIKHAISSKLKAKMQFPCRINGSDVGLTLGNDSLPSILVDTLTFSQTDVSTERNDISKLYFQVRLYETDADFRLSHGTILSFVQEGGAKWILDRFEVGGGVIRTPEMIKHNLLWVVAKSRIKIDQYPTWNDMVQINTWYSVPRKGRFNCNCVISDAKTGEIFIRASGLTVLMNANTRQLCKVSAEVMAEFEPYCHDLSPFIHEDNTILSKLNDDTADVILKMFMPKWTDIDFNKHVNHVKYITWILETVPEWLGLGYEITSIALDYRRECAPTQALQSLVTISPVIPSDGDVLSNTGKNLQSEHLIRFENGAEILRGRIGWKPREPNLSYIDKNRLIYGLHK